jgi:hypothetical protein
MENLKYKGMRIEKLEVLHKSLPNYFGDAFETNEEVAYRNELMRNKDREVKIQYQTKREMKATQRNLDKKLMTPD